MGKIVLELIGLMVFLLALSCEKKTVKDPIEENQEEIQQEEDSYQDQGDDFENSNSEFDESDESEADNMEDMNGDMDSGMEMDSGGGGVISGGAKFSPSRNLCKKYRKRGLTPPKGCRKNKRRFRRRR